MKDRIEEYILRLVERSTPEKTAWNLEKIRAGEPVTLTSRIEGFDGYEIRYQWECDKHDGSGFRDVSGATGSSYSFSASAESLSWDWRLSVYFH